MSLNNEKGSNHVVPDNTELELTADNVTATIGLTPNELMSKVPYVIVGAVGIKNNALVIKITLSQHPYDNVLIQIGDRLYKLIETMPDPWPENV